MYVRLSWCMDYVFYIIYQRPTSYWNGWNLRGKRKQRNKKNEDESFLRIYLKQNFSSISKFSGLVFPSAKKKHDVWCCMYCTYIRNAFWKLNCTFPTISNVSRHFPIFSSKWKKELLWWTHEMIFSNFTHFISICFGKMDVYQRNLKWTFFLYIQISSTVIGFHLVYPMCTINLSHSNVSRKLTRRKNVEQTCDAILSNMAI